MFADQLPWHSRFDGILDEDSIRSLISVRPSRQRGLERLPAETARVQLERGLAGIYVPTAGTIHALSELVQRAQAHSLDYYESVAGYLEGVYAPTPPLGVGQITCLTGLAGVGKTRAVERLMSMFGGLQRIRVDAGHAQVPLLTALYCKQGSKTSTREVLHELSVQAGADLLTKAKSEGKLILLLQRLAYVSGICLLVYDEAQLKTLSSAANTAMTHLLLQLRDIGIPVVAVLNYSMVNRLFKRNHEDRDRLLSDPIVLDPPGAGSACFLTLLQEYRNLAPEVFSLDMQTHEKRIHDMSAGLPRLMCKLIGLAYVIARAERSTSIGISHLTQAYNSRKYSAHRGDVGAIHDQAANPEQAVRVDKKPRWDLFCPFKNVDLDAHLAKKVKEGRKEEVASRRLVDSLSPAEKKIVQTAAKAVGATVDAMHKPERAKSVPRPKTAEALLGNQACVMELLRRRSKNKC